MKPFSKHALSPVGGLVWLFNAGDGQPIQSSAAVGQQAVYAASTDGSLYAITNGGLAWKWSNTNVYGYAAPFLSSPAVIETPAGETVVVGSEDNSVYGVTNGSVAWSYSTSGQVISSPNINPANAAVVIASEDGNVYQIPGRGPLAESQWPEFHRDIFHAGALPSSGCATPNALAAFPNNAYLPYNASGPTQFSFDLSGTPGSLWVIYAATNLNSDWAPIGSVTLYSPYGYAYFTDDTVSNAASRFYQARSGTSCSRVIAFVNASLQPGANLIADQLYQDNDYEYPQNAAYGWQLFLDYNGYPFPPYPDQSQLLNWNGSGFAMNEYLAELADWTNPASPLIPGKAEFFINPTNYTVTLPFAGWVAPGLSTNVIAPGTNYLSSALPAAGYIQSDLAYDPKPGDIVQLWNGSSFSNYTYSGSWSPREPYLNVGQGFALVTASSNQWVQDFEPCYSAPLPSLLFTNYYGGGVPIMDSPAAGPDGSIYLATYTNFYCLTEDGGVRWVAALDTTDTEQGQTSSAMVTSNAVYIGSADGFLRAFNPTNGSVLWSNYLGGEIVGTPALQPANGLIIVGTFNASSFGDTNGVFAVTTNGSLAWAFFGDGGLDIRSSVASGPDCSLYFVSGDEAPDVGLSALDSQGNLKWRVPFEIASAPVPSPSLDGAGNIYIGTGRGIFYCLSPNGETLWSFQVPNQNAVVSSAVIGSDLTAYFSDSAGVMWAVTNGAAKWAFTNQYGGQLSTPALDADNTLYFGSTESDYFFAIANGLPLWQFPTPGPVHSWPTLTQNGTVCFGTDAGGFFTLPAASPPTNSPWSMFQGGAAHLGAIADQLCSATCPAPIITDINFSGDTLTGYIIGPPGSSWHLLVKGDVITNWTSLGVMQLDSTGTTNFVDSSTEVGISNRIYQLDGAGCCSRLFGFVTLPILPGSNLIVDPFLQNEDNGFLPMNSLLGLFDEAGLTNGTQIAIWNGSGLDAYTFANTNGDQWFLNGVENESGLLLPGLAAWLNNPNSLKSVTFAGLAAYDPGSAVSVPIVTGTNYLGAAVPEPGLVMSNLNYAPNNADTISLWNAASQSFSSYTYNSSNGWYPSQPYLNLGQGFLLNASQSNQWLEYFPDCGSSITATLIVTADPLWTDSGFTVQPGNTIIFPASGQWSGGYDQGITGAQGVGVDGFQWDLFLTNIVTTNSQSAPHDSLLAFVGSNPFFDPTGTTNEWGNSNYFPRPNGTGYWEVGTNGQFTTDRSGALWFGINDAAVSGEPGASDNTGELIGILTIITND